MITAGRIGSHARIPDTPDAITSGDILADAFANPSEVLDVHLESLQSQSQCGSG